MSQDEVMAQRLNNRLTNIAELLSLVAPDKGIQKDLPLEVKAESILDVLGEVLPEEFSLAEIAVGCNKNKKTIYNYLTENFLEGEGYRLSEKGGKIYVARDVTLRIRRHYAR